jgi:hypothetical protein
MFRHVVMFRWKPETTAEAVAAVADALAGLPAKIPELRAYHFGSDARINAGNYDFVVSADFDDESGYLAYRDHPEHRAVADTLIVPHITDRAAVQFAC